MRQQINIILGPATKGTLTGDEMTVLGKRLLPLVAVAFETEKREKDVSSTMVWATTTVDEADIQIEIRYTVGIGVYKHGKMFDPTPEQQEALIDLIEPMVYAFLEARKHPKFSLSVWCQPYRNSVFRLCDRSRPGGSSL